jgi:2-phosphosulfolactate phosphatase
MKIRTIQYKKNLSEDVFQHSDTYVIDVFRATSVIVTALAHGAAEIIATEEIHDALQEKLAFPESILGGERNSIKPEEFDFGNSPCEYFSMQGKRLVLSTSNGTRAIKKAGRSSATYICSFLNLKAVIDHIQSRNQDVILLMAGVREEFSYEDGLCAGAVIHGLGARHADLELDDLSLLLKKTFDMEQHQLPAALNATFSYTKLARHGFAGDIDFCLQENVYHQLPRCRFGANGVSISFN